MSSLNDSEQRAADEPPPKISPLPPNRVESQCVNIFVDFDGMILIIGIKVSRTTIWRWVKAGQFPKPTKLAGTLLAWKRGELIEWLEQQYEKRLSNHRSEDN